MARSNPDRSQLWQTLKLFGACAIASLAATLIGLPKKYWALIGGERGGKHRLGDDNRSGYLVLELGQHHLALLPMFWLALLPVALLVAWRPYLRLSAVTLVVVLVPSSGTPYVRPFDRVVEILLGTLAAIVAAAVIRVRTIETLTRDPIADPSAK